MNTIIIEVPGEELSTFKIELTSEEVVTLYKLRKENAATIDTLEKSIKELEKLKKYLNETLSAAHNELEQGHALLATLGVADKTGHEETYYRKSLSIATRIALYIVNVTKEKK